MLNAFFFLVSMGSVCSTIVFVHAYLCLGISVHTISSGSEICRWFMVYASVRLYLYVYGVGCESMFAWAQGEAFSLFFFKLCVYRHTYSSQGI